MNELSGVPVSANGAVLSAGHTPEDRASLERILRGSGWVFLATQTLASSLRILRERTVSIVICDDDLFPGTWREMLKHLAVLDDPPLLLVTARQADERLWAEALNLGACDVLATPLDVMEAIRIIDMAQQRWLNRRELHGSRSKPKRAAAGAGSRGEEA
jgi:DNA-binding response OmpR family regulator